MKCIAYKDGYKYQLAESYSISIEIRPERDVTSDGFLSLTADGRLTMEKGYAWDGPSGPTIDTRNFMRGSLVHDALYQLMRQGKLDRKHYRKDADRLLQTMCKEDGMSAVRAWGVYVAVRAWGEKAASEDKRKKIIHAPKGCPVIPTRPSATELHVSG